MKEEEGTRQRREGEEEKEGAVHCLRSQNPQKRRLEDAEGAERRMGEREEKGRAKQEGAGGRAEENERGAGHRLHSQKQQTKQREEIGGGEKGKKRKKRKVEVKKTELFRKKS